MDLGTRLYTNERLDNASYRMFDNADLVRQFYSVFVEINHGLNYYAWIVNLIKWFSFLDELCYLQKKTKNILSIFSEKRELHRCKEGARVWNCTEDEIRWLLQTFVPFKIYSLLNALNRGIFHQLWWGLRSSRAFNKTHALHYIFV